MLGMILAVLSGALMSVQGIFNTAVTKQTSVWLAASFVQFLALIVCVIAWFVTGKQGTVGMIFQVTPKYFLIGGAIGAFITYTVIESISGLGPAKAIMLIVVSQLLVAYIIELFGMFGTEKVDFAWKKLIGLVLIIAGIITFKWE